MDILQPITMVLSDMLRQAQVFMGVGIARAVAQATLFSYATKTEMSRKDRLQMVNTAYL